MIQELFLLQKIREYKEAGNDEIHVICYFLLFVFTGVIEQEAAFLLVSESSLQNSRLHGWCGECHSCKLQWRIHGMMEETG